MSRGGFGALSNGVKFHTLFLSSSSTSSSSCASKPRSLCFPARCLRTEAANSGKKEKVIVISGPTGAGKSRLALKLAKRINGEIISADSVQVYRGLDIGAAKPSVSDREEVPHHLLDKLHPSEDYSVGQFFDDARQATEDVMRSGHVPIVVGGTGLYLRWYIYGKPEVPKATAEVASEVSLILGPLEETGDWDAAVQLLENLGDPKAHSLPRNNWYRARRSFEIIKATGSPPSAFRVPYESFKGQFDSEASDVPDRDRLLVNGMSDDLEYDFICFFLSSQRVDLYKSIDLRCEEMVRGNPGILTEASWLLDLGLLPNENSATRAIGYRQAMEYLLSCRQDAGRSSSREFLSFLSEFQKASRNFAKRQMTWFRNEKIYQWLDASQPLERVLDFIVDTYLGKNAGPVPKQLSMGKDISSRREVYELKSYQTRRRYFKCGEDCSPILDWIMHTQR